VARQNRTSRSCVARGRELRRQQHFRPGSYLRGPLRPRLDEDNASRYFSSSSVLRTGERPHPSLALTWTGSASLLDVGVALDQFGFVPGHVIAPWSSRRPQSSPSLHWEGSRAASPPALGGRRWRACSVVNAMRRSGRGADHPRYLSPTTASPRGIWTRLHQVREEEKLFLRT
jgi:hypothetical protein